MRQRKEKPVEEERRLYLVLVGDRGTGKTSITMSFMSDVFRNIHRLSLTDCYRKWVDQPGRRVDIEILDADSWGNFDFKRKEYLEAADGFILNYAIDDIVSFRSVKSYYEDILSLKNGEPTSFVLVGNKVDLATTHRQVDRALAKYMSSLIGCPFIECSAKRHINVNDIFEKLVAETDNKKKERAKNFEVKKRCSIF